jgi:hypothetical protein
LDNVGTNSSSSKEHSSPSNSSAEPSSSQEHPSSSSSSSSSQPSSSQEHSSPFKEHSSEENISSIIDLSDENNSIKPQQQAKYSKLSSVEIEEQQQQVLPVETNVSI